MLGEALGKRSLDHDTYPSKSRRPSDSVAPWRDMGEAGLGPPAQLCVA